MTLTPETLAMARPHKPDGTKRTILIRVRVTPAEKQQLTEAAVSRGLSLSDHLRSKAIGSDPLVRKASPERAAIIQALGQLGKIGSNVNQMAHVLNRQQLAGRAIDVPAELIRQALAGVHDLTDKLLGQLNYGHPGTDEG